MAQLVPPQDPRKSLASARPQQLPSTGARDDLYHYLLTAPWFELIGFVAMFFVAANLIFATGYYLDGGIENTHSGSFLDMFFFSIQTMATIGYGKMEPISLFCNILVSIEALFGLLGLAVITGLTFSKFSRATARVRFSHCAIVAPRDGVSSLMFRMANLRNNRIVEAEIHVVFARQEVTLEGDSVRRFYDLQMSRSRSALFQLSWTAIHPILENSPLYGQTPESLGTTQGEILVSLIGFDETFSQTVHARYSYSFDNIRWGVRFLDVLTRQPDGSLNIDYSNFDEVEPIAIAEQ